MGGTVRYTRGGARQVRCGILRGARGQLRVRDHYVGGKGGRQRSTSRALTLGARPGGIWGAVVRGRGAWPGLEVMSALCERKMGFEHRRGVPLLGSA